MSNKKYESLFKYLNKESVEFLLKEENQNRIINYIESLSPNNSIYAWLIYFIKEIRDIKGTQDAFTGTPSMSDINKLVPDNILNTIDSLISTDTNNPLSANQGRVLRNMIEDLKERVESLYNINITNFIEYKNKSLYEVSTNLYGKTMNLGIEGYSLRNIVGVENRYFSVSDNNNIPITEGILKPGALYTIVMDIPESQEIKIQLKCGDIPVSSKVKFNSKNGRNIIQLQTYNRIFYNNKYYLNVEVHNPPFDLSNIMVLEGNVARINEIPEYVEKLSHITKYIGNGIYGLDLVSIGQNKLNKNEMKKINNWNISDNFGFKYFKVSNLNPFKKYIFAINNNTSSGVEIVISQYPNKIEKIIIKGSDNKAAFPIIYPNMFGEIYIGAKNVTEDNFNTVISTLENSYLVQTNYDLDEPSEYKEEIKNIRLNDHIVSDPYDSSFFDKIYHDKEGEIKYQHKFATLNIPKDSIITKYIGSSGEYLENDDTELFICNFYSNINIDHVSNHNFCTEFTYISPYLSTYIDIGEYCTIEKDKDKPVPLYIDDDYTELLIKDDKTLYIRPIKDGENLLKSENDNSTNFESKSETLEEFKLIINISKSKLNKIIAEDNSITDRTEALRKYIKEKNLKLYLELNTPYEEIIPIPGFNISIFEEGSTVTTNSDLKPIFDFVMPNSLGTILQSQISQINNIYKVLYNDILPNITEI